MSRGQIWRNLLKKSPYEPLADPEAVTVLGEAIRRGLLEGGAAASSGPLWEAISASGDGAWNEVLDRCVHDLRRRGYTICRTTEG